MSYTMELRYIGGDLADLTHDMRVWLGQNGNQGGIISPFLCFSRSGLPYPI